MGALNIPDRIFRDAHGLLTDAADESRPAFDAEYVDRFINEFAKSEGDPVEWLEDRGIGENYGKSLIGPSCVRHMCREWIVNPLNVYAICGVEFWRMMHELASTAYDAE